MAATSSGRKRSSPNLLAQANELWQLVRDYAIQQIKEPLVGAVRFLGYGLAGGLLFGLGGSLVGLSILRFLQTETGSAFEGHLSFVPYLIVAVYAGAIIAFAVSKMGSNEEATSA